MNQSNNNSNPNDQIGQNPPQNGVNNNQYPNQTTQGHSLYSPQQIPVSPVQQPQYTGGGDTPEILPSVGSNERLSIPEVRESEPSIPDSEKKQEQLVSEKKKLPQQQHSHKDKPKDATPEETLGVKIDGYGISMKLAQMKTRLHTMQGNGSYQGGKSWLLILLDRILRKEDKDGHVHSA